MTNMMFSFNGTKLLFSDRLIHTLPYKIEKLIEINSEKCLVLLDQDNGVLNENVLIINKVGEIIWRVPKYSYVDRFSPFINIKSQDGHLKLSNWDGSYLDVTENGEIIKDIYEVRKNRRPW